MAQDRCAFRYDYPWPHEHFDSGCQFTEETELFPCDGSLYCRLHLPLLDKQDKLTVKADWRDAESDGGRALRVAVQRRVADARAASRGLNLSGTVFPDDMVFGETAIPASLWYGTRFHGRVGFINAKLQGYAVFQHAEFHGTAHFLDTDFQGNAYFDNADFQGNAVFRDVGFWGNAHFLDTRFQGIAYFRKVKIHGNAHFRDAEFQGHAHFRQVEFQGKADFSSSDRRRHKSNGRRWQRAAIRLISHRLGEPRLPRPAALRSRGYGSTAHCLEVEPTSAIGGLKRRQTCPDAALSWRPSSTTRRCIRTQTGGK